MLDYKLFYVTIMLTVNLFYSFELQAEEQKTFANEMKIVKVNELKYHSINATSREIEFKWLCQKKGSNINKCILYDKHGNAILRFLFGFRPENGKILAQKCFVKDRESEWQIIQGLYYVTREGIQSPPTTMEIINGKGKQIGQGWNSTVKSQLKRAGLSGSHDCVVELLGLIKNPPLIWSDK